MTKSEIKAALAGKNIKQRAIATEAKCSEGYVSDVLAGNRTSEAIERIVARLLGKARASIFPITREAI